MRGRVEDFAKFHEAANCVSRMVLTAAEKLVEAVSNGRFVSGHDFSRADRVTKSCWALAPAVLVFSYLQFRSG
jgi:hypothetical protein